MKLRVETAAAPGGFIPRQVVNYDDSQPVKVNDTVSCPGNSPIGVLNAVVGPTGWTATASSTTPDTTQLATIKSATLRNQVQWATYLSTRYADKPCTATVNAGDEVLFYPCVCATSGTAGCFPGGPLWFRFQLQNFFGVDVTNVGWNIPVTLFGIESPAPNQPGVPGASTMDSTLTTDLGFTARTDNRNGDGSGAVQFPEKGPHSVTMTEANKVPDRAAVCVSDGVDGYCGYPQSNGSPFDPNNYPSECTTNGHDGFCGHDRHVGPGGHRHEHQAGPGLRRQEGPRPGQGHDGARSQRRRLGEACASRARPRRVSGSRPRSRRRRARRSRRCATGPSSAARPGTTRPRCWRPPSAAPSTPSGAEADLDDLSAELQLRLRADAAARHLHTRGAGRPTRTTTRTRPTPGRNVITFTVKTR